MGPAKSEHPTELESAYCLGDLDFPEGLLPPPLLVRSREPPLPRSLEPPLLIPASRMIISSA